MKTLRIVTAVCLFAATFGTLSQAQNSTGTTNDKVVYNSWSATLSGGSMLFYGDLRQFDFYPMTKQNGKDWKKFTRDVSERQWGFGLAVSKQFTPIWGIQGFFQNGKLSGAKKSVDAYFETNFYSIGIDGKINVLPIFNPLLEKKKYSVYGLFGIGYCTFKVMESKISDGTEIHSYGYGNYGQETKRTRELNIPVGFGVKYKITDRVDIGLELTLNNVNTDKLDARVKPLTAKDKYQYTSIGISYNIGKAAKAVEWTNPKEKEADNLAPLFAALNKKIDSLGQKLNDVDGKVGVLQKEVADLKNFAKQTEAEKAKVIAAAPVAAVAAAPEIIPQFSVFFKVNSSYVDALNQEKVVTMVKILKENANLKLELVGYADKTGGQLYNEILSKKRAQAVYDLLVKSYGIEAGRVSVIGKGVENALSSDILSVNRRVDFIIKK